jgi:signal transduction histidine kinase
MSSAQDTSSFPELVALACHDLRTPLATIYGFARTLARMEDLGEPATRYLGMVEASAAQLGELLDELSLAARIQSGRYDPTLESVDSAGFGRAAAERLGEDRVDVTGEGGPVSVDRQPTERAVSALAQCALRYGGLDRVTVRAAGSELQIEPITPASSPVVLGQDLRDLGAAVAVRLVRALGGAVELDGDVLRVTLPAA